MVASVILNGGFETSLILLSTGLVELLRDRRQWELLCADPSLVPAAVEELMRHVSPAQWVIRSARQDVDWDGFEIAAGDVVLPCIGSANRDEAVFERPDELDLLRPPRQHLGLGFGIHFCLGASLIRNEARVTLGTLASRYPDLELALDPDSLDWGESRPNMRTLDSLPVTLGPPRKHG
jgi:cytochrome P450